mmetsp:Transcript_32711/g.82465  ORF Transcript_32711/g.82465 Transcript_32711/m.82465 type:complete len:233 (-) Transcript_32711:1473-2171(-)
MRPTKMSSGLTASKSPPPPPPLPPSPAKSMHPRPRRVACVTAASSAVRRARSQSARGVTNSDSTSATGSAGPAAPSASPCISASSAALASPAWYMDSGVPDPVVSDPDVVLFRISSCAASCSMSGSARMLLSRPPPWHSALKLAPVANRPRSMTTSPSANRRRDDVGSVRPWSTAAKHSHHPSAACAQPSSLTRAPSTGSKLLVSVSLLRRAAPSHSRFGGRSATSARRAAA